jgi:hypothetical protein
MFLNGYNTSIAKFWSVSSSVVKKILEELSVSCGQGGEFGAAQKVICIGHVHVTLELSSLREEP